MFAFADRFYGFPNIDGAGVKVAIHWDEGNALADANQPVGAAGEKDLRTIFEMANRYLAGVAGRIESMRARVRSARACLYTMTPDENFIIDRHPLTDGVSFAAGFSGHGFKFALVIGEALAGMALDGGTAPPVGFLAAPQRFSRAC